MKKNRSFSRRTSPAGLFDSTMLGDKAGVFEQVAFVSVVEGVSSTLRAEVPVPLLSEQPYLIKISNQPETTTLDDLPKTALKISVNDAFSIVEQVITDIQKQATAKEGSRSHILAIAHDGWERAREAYPRLRGTR